MPDHNAAIHIERFSESHIEAVTALYNERAVTRQVLQMPFQSIDVWRQRLLAENERVLKLVALHQGQVIGHLGLENYSRIRRSHAGSVGMAVAVAWQGKGVGSTVVGGGAGRRRQLDEPAPRRTHRCTPTTRRPSVSTANSVSRPKACFVITPCATGSGSTP